MDFVDHLDVEGAFPVMQFFMAVWRGEKHALTQGVKRRIHERHTMLKNLTGKFAWLLYCNVLLASGTAQAAPFYTITDLGTLGGVFSYGAKINNAGQVTGSSTTSTGTTHAFIYSNGAMTDLGTLGGSYSYGYDINNAGQVTGYAYNSNNTANAFIYSNGTMTFLGSLVGSTANSTGSGINDAGQVAGTSSSSSDNYNHAVIYSNGSITDLGSNSLGIAINNAGQTLIYSGAHAVIYKNGIMTDLGTLAGVMSFGADINNAEQVTGYSTFSTTNYSSYHAFLYSNGSMIDLGTLGGASSYGWGINDAGDVVGYSLTNIGQHHAFKYTAGQMMDLNSIVEVQDNGWELYEAMGINDAGQITGYGTINGQTHAFLLSPRLHPVTPVPEPASLTLFGLGLVSLWNRRRRTMRKYRAAELAHDKT
ncbi:PEP-CTERM sorting domain-containing protein [Noviherbaspirillum autotrophicum]|uniref:PEP-CTERM sorting domain-containing protein n=1 Tax=Noviherbaspirillum autotrophicum TaxID=709839 RepID=UPI0018E037E0|nr:PEP-CTERM sorting domain-containing protein [Noviherbaspirillum autotrophicum]